MGFNKGDILLDSPTGAYYSGQMVNGRIIFNLNKPKKLRGIYMTVKGYCKVHWTSQRSRRTQDNRTEHYTVNHESYEEYINLKVYLFGGKNAEHTLDPGHNEFPFTFQLPDTCPSSYEGSNGHIRYELRCVMDIPYAIDKEKGREFKVHAPLDLNMQHCNEPVSFEFDQAYCCWCISGGSSHTVVKMPASGFCPGQAIPIEVYCQNRSTVEIDWIKFAIKKEVTFNARNEPDTRSEKETVLEEKKGPVAPHTDRRWDVQLVLPDIDVHNLNACSFIDVAYKFKVTVSPSGCHDDEDDSCDFILGTIPLREMQTSIPQISQINMAPTNYPPIAAPYPQAVVTQPTCIPFPQNSPYPVPQPAPTPYTHPPQPGVAPYPQPMVAPYPLPGITPQPQPGAAPYPNPGVPPNLHPVASPYPNPGVPPNLHTGAPPYPQLGVTPYAQVPSPAVVQNNLVKSPDPGFVVGGHKPDEASVPLLPMGIVPYPLPRPASPYHSASAPEPTSTPDSNTKTFEINTNPSPYNPAFMNAEKKDEDKKEKYDDDDFHDDVTL